MPKEKFEQWMKKVDTYFIKKVGVSTEDLPDADYRTMYEEGLPPSDVHQLVLADIDMLVL